MPISKETERLNKKYRSSMHYVLSGLMPYTEANLKLTFMPHRYFADLEKLDYVKAKNKSLKTAYYRAIKKGYIELGEGSPRLTDKGRLRIKKYKPQKLGRNARLLVIFDIPEELRAKRDRLRKLLKQLNFTQIQKSVWETEYDCREFLRAEIIDQGLDGLVFVYESNRLEI